VTREGRQEVGVLCITDEAGEPTQGCAKKMRKHRAVPEMKVGPSEPSCRGEASNRHKLLRPKAAVVNVMVKRRDSDHVMCG